MKYKLIVNPTSGRGNGERSIPTIVSLLQRYDLDFDLVRTQAPWHAVELARSARDEGYDVVVAVGGDGTANEVINGLMQTSSSSPRCAMGVLSVGRGNDFAYSMGIPTDLEAGCHTLAKGRRSIIDVGKVTGGDAPYSEERFFGNGVGIGFDAVVGFEAVKLTWLSGFPSYIVAVLKTVFLYYRAPLVEICFDGQTITQPALMVSVMNGQRMGGGFFMAPNGRPDDGQFDLCIARQVSRPRIFALIPHFLRGSQGTQEPIRMAQGQRVTVRAIEGTLPAHADGETLCTAGQELILELLPHQIEIIHRDREGSESVVGD